MKKIKILCTTLFIIFCLTACSESSDVADQVANVVQSEDEHVLSVKNGTNSNYPDKTYGEAFKNYFDSPTWKYFKGTKEGTDEDGDGKPDSEEEDVDIVEFTGYCMYQEVKVKALIQFTLNDDNTFSATFLSFNDVPQNMFILAAVIEKAFTNGESTTTETSTEVSVEVLTEFNGLWYDTYSQRCNMEIVCQNDTYYEITVDWGSSAWDNTHWEFTGEYDAKQGGIVYQNGCRYEQHYPEDGGDLQQTETYTNGEGFIYIKDGKLYWNDKTQDMGKDCVFEKQDTTGTTNEKLETDTEWYRINQFFYNSETGVTLEVGYYDDGSLDFIFDGTSTFSYFGDDSFVENSTIYYNCNDGTQVQYFSDTTPYIRIVGNDDYNGYYYLQ